jgi:filamentous hemagglutinin family protein
MQPRLEIGSLLLVSTLLVAALPCQAQVTSAIDGTQTIVQQAGNTFNITGGTTAGSNLFHSFQQFGLTQGQVASFLANPAIQNVLGRVTGGEASVINGLLQVTGSNANLYLMNPAGIVFGANARLDVAGSFTATTANGIGFGDRWLNAVGANNYATLIGDPSSFAFTMTQPGAIVNAGNLAVGTGQSLTLLGGTVINTGTLTAPEGELTIAAVPSEKLVRLTSTGSLLSLDLPTDAKAAINPLPFSPLTLPELLTGGNLSNATGLTIENGIVKLIGSRIVVESGDVVAKTVSAQTATVSAANNLILTESEFSTTGDLSLLAQNTVRIRDSAAKPVLIQAGNNLTIQGNQAIDIFALNHADSGLVSGGDMVLRSTTSIVGDAHYWAGGNFTVEQLDGKLGKLTSPYDPVILALGSVRLDSYSGTSLHILAGGSVTLGNVSITDCWRCGRDH